MNNKGKAYCSNSVLLNILNDNSTTYVIKEIETILKSLELEDCLSLEEKYKYEVDAIKDCNFYVTINDLFDLLNIPKYNLELHLKGFAIKEKDSCNRRLFNFNSAIDKINSIYKLQLYSKGRGRNNVGIRFVRRPLKELDTNLFLNYEKRKFRDFIS